MTPYSFKAFDEKGRIRFGQVNSENYSDAEKKLKEQSFVIVELRAERDRLSSLWQRKKIPPDQELFFYVQFSSLLQVEIPLLRSLELLTQQITHLPFKKALEESQGDIKQGRSLSEAFRKHDHFFSTLVLGMIEAGEETGQLDTIFLQLAKMKEQEQQYKQDILGAIAYPALLLFSALTVASIIVLFVYPRFLEIFKENEIPLPLITQLLAHCSDFVRESGMMILALLVSAFLGLRYFFGRTLEGQSALDHLLHNTPWVGELFLMFHLQRFCFNLSLLSKNGIPLLKSVELLAKTLTNLTMTRLLADIWVTLREGGAMSEALQKHKNLPPVFPQLVAIGEQVGKMEPLLEKLSEHYSFTVNRKLKRLTLALEPLLLLGLGLFVTFLMASLLLPMFHMVKTIH